MSIARMIAASSQRVIPVEFVGYVYDADSAVAVNGVDYEAGDVLIAYSASYLGSASSPLFWTEIDRKTNSNPDEGILQSVAVSWRVAEGTGSYTVAGGSRDNLILVFRAKSGFSASLSAAQLVLDGGAAGAAVPSNKASAWIAISNVASGGVTTSYSGSPLETTADPDCKFAYKFYPKLNSAGTQTVEASGFREGCIAISFAFE